MIRPISELIIRLTNGFIRKMGRAPNKLEEMKIKQEALENYRESTKVIDMKTGAPMDQQGIASLAKQPKKPATGFKSLSDEATKRGEARHILSKDEFKDILTPKQLDELNNPDSRKDVLKLYEEVFGKKALDVLPGTGTKVDSDNLFDLLINTTDKKGLDPFDPKFDPSSALDNIKKGITRNKKDVDNIAGRIGKEAEDFESVKTSFNLNITKNSPEFNKSIGDQIIKREIYADLNDGQRKELLDMLDNVMKNPEDIEPFAAGGRVGFAKGSKGIMSKISNSTVMQMLSDPRILGTELGVEGALETLRLFGLYSEGGRVGLAEGTEKPDNGLSKLLNL